ncbi:biotin-dependent carboxyltransferase family protein [Paenarthrobacter sp. CM16]|uniref:5-oxoprolinase subunit C family protein n=1 Tax=Paenarthrobacter sp. CM16 TaxID=2738447 RepID=UPI0015536FF6|nr:biotin-dependent carboxyltransferase family protein [Paenarthrobacter sp. CM16]NQD87444.1 biotin-dependent carboxyltransferase family protein [Paenarthrobacter sp. CM16]
MGAVVAAPGMLTLALAPDHALDRTSLQLANALLGNPKHAAGLEVLVGGLKLRFVTGSAVAVTGAEGVVTLNGSEFPLNTAVRVAPGAVLAFGPALFGIRYYVALQGGVQESGEVLSAGAAVTFGKPYGQALPAGNNPVGNNPVGNGSAVHHSAVRQPGVIHPARRALDPERPVVARISRVPKDPKAQDVDAGTWLRLTTEPWTLSQESDRVGARLLGRPLEVGQTAPAAKAQAAEPQPLALGSVVLPPSGLPVIALADRPATAKSPVIALVRDEDLDLLGQARPGQMVHLLG